MSQENVEIVRQGLALLNAGDWDAFSELLDPTVHVDLSQRVFNPEVYEGYDGITRWRAEDPGEVWESYRSEPEQFFEGEKTVVAFIRERGRGKGSGVEIDRRSALLCKLRAGKLNEIRLYLDRERALRDAGLAG